MTRQDLYDRLTKEFVETGDHTKKIVLSRADYASFVQEEWLSCRALLHRDNDGQDGLAIYGPVGLVQVTYERGQ